MSIKNDMCKCGHKRYAHGLYPTGESRECYRSIRRSGSVYACICDKFDLSKG